MENQKIEVNTLTGPLLDYWAGKADNLNVRLEYYPTTTPRPTTVWVMDENGRPDYTKGKYSPSTNWAQGGLIIDKENITVGKIWNDGEPGVHSLYNAKAQIPFIDGKPNYDAWAYGPTVLIAAMRCFVISKFGDTVEALKL